MRKSTLLACMFVSVLGITTAGAGASQYAQPDKSKPASQATKQKAGKVHTMTGCLEKGTAENAFRLTNVEGTGPKTVELEATASKNLAAHVGHKIAITGSAVEPKAATTGTAGKPETPAPPSTTGAPASTTGAEHTMRVNSVKMIAESCS